PSGLERSHAWERPDGREPDAHVRIDERFSERGEQPWSAVGPPGRNRAHRRRADRAGRIAPRDVEERVRERFGRSALERPTPRDSDRRAPNSIVDAGEARAQ